jgi:signal peptidase II
MRYRFYLLSLFVFVLDHVTKSLVSSLMDLPHYIDVIPGYARLSYVRNSGVAFGLFADFHAQWKPYVLASMAVVAVIVILIYSSRMPSDRTLLQAALAVTLGGILGNFTDRVVHGYVVDFIELHIQDRFHWPTFNVADSAITIGIAMLLLDTIRNPEPHRHQKEMV